MALQKQERITKARKQLEEALDRYRKAKGERDLEFLTVAKAFEVLFEYVWKLLKTRVEGEGLFAPSPKESIRQAAAIHFIKKPERWLACATARNDSVHDYFGIPEDDYIALAKEFLSLSKGLLKS
jgi:hypothetical protein